jgi:hypothetical protein
MVVTEDGVWNSIDANDKQSRKAHTTMAVTEEGILIDGNDEQS